MLRLAKKKTVPPPVLDRILRRLTRRLLRACTAAEPQWGYYHQFAIANMKSYQDLLADRGLVGYWVVPLAETDHRIDALMLGCSDGRVLDIPDPFEEIGPPPFPLLHDVMDFFLSIAQTVSQKSRITSVGPSS
ncbi:hypothetical protein BE21_19935 [Sorangium cellulosum]|uniref:Uncharacterized protein n=1 Tax=Sorangium cellulosum TaxID=56 RepID=A0A150TWS5_SORCE|nr:hypothetical protein BE21_19935 [Sorangium cellulosum]